MDKWEVYLSRLRAIRSERIVLYNNIDAQSIEKKFDLLYELLEEILTDIAQK